MYDSFQLIWQDNTGEHLFVSSYANAFQSAMTLAIALQNTQSATYVEIVRCKDNLTKVGGIEFKIEYKWGTKK